MPTGLLHLPQETLSQIIASAGIARRSVAASLSLVCKPLLQPAQKALYTDVVLKTASSAVQFWATIVKRPDLAAMVRHFDCERVMTELAICYRDGLHTVLNGISLNLPTRLTSLCITHTAGPFRITDWTRNDAEELTLVLDEYATGLLVDTALRSAVWKWGRLKSLTMQGVLSTRTVLPIPSLPPQVKLRLDMLDLRMLQFSTDASSTSFAKYFTARRLKIRVSAENPIDLQLLSDLKPERLEIEYDDVEWHAYGGYADLLIHFHLPHIPSIRILRISFGWFDLTKLLPLPTKLEELHLSLCWANNELDGNLATGLAFLLDVFNSKSPKLPSKLRLITFDLPFELFSDDAALPFGRLFLRQLVQTLHGAAGEAIKIQVNLLRSPTRPEYLMTRMPAFQQGRWIA